jgi:hypothetical protein
MLSLIGNPSSLYLNRALHGRVKMANYISRVELHSASYEDYETLHGAMQRQGIRALLLVMMGQPTTCRQVRTMFPVQQLHLLKH